MTEMAEDYSDYSGGGGNFTCDADEMERYLNATGPGSSLAWREACAEPLQPFMVVIQVFYALICVLGLCGNTLVIYVVLRYSKMQTVTNLYIFNLALADECFLVGIPFLVVTSWHKEWIFGIAMCKIYMTTTSINQFTSSIFLTVMSADRYVAVCHPISSPKFRTNVIARVVSLTAWATSALLMVPVFMYAATIKKMDGMSETCNIYWPWDSNDGTIGIGGHDNETAIHIPGEDDDTAPLPQNFTGRPRHVLNGQTAFTFYSFVLGFAVPLLLILTFYILVIVKLQTVGPKNKSKERRKSHRKVTRLVLTVITVYILCWLPYWITQLSLIFTPPGQNQDDIMVAVMLLAGCLSYSNSAMNPILYAFLSDNFKKSFMKACACATGREANRVLEVENSVMPRRRTLLAGAGHHAHNASTKARAMAKAAGERLHLSPDDAHHHHHGKGGNGGTGGNGIEVGGGGIGAHRAECNKSQIELNDVSTGVTGSTTVTSRSSRSFDVSSSVNPKSEAGPSSTVSAVEVAAPRLSTATTVNGSLAPPQTYML